MSPDSYRKSARLLRRMYAVLMDAYGPQHWWPAETPLEVIVGAYLTQSTSWRAVEKSIANLRARGILNVAGLRAVSEEDLRGLIRPSGFIQRKALSIKAFIHYLDREYDGSLHSLSLQNPETTRQQLLALPGVGPETADAILLYALGQPTIVVDEYLRRLVTRHELLHENIRYAELQQLAVDAFAEDDLTSLNQHYNEFHALVVELGKRHCKRQPACDGCPLSRPIFHPPHLPAGNISPGRKAAAKT